MTRSTKAYIALIFICLVWGTTYLAIRIAVLHFPSFLFAAIRQVISGTIIMLIGLMFSRKIDLSKRNLMHQALIGFLLITIGNGFVSYGEKFIPSGVAALLCSLMPLCAVIINLASSKHEKLNLPIIAGMLLGFGGVGLIFKDNLSDLTNSLYLKGMLCIFLATFSWALGSVINKKRVVQINAVFNSGIQLFIGGTLLFILSPFIDSYEHLNFFDHNVIWPMLYLISFGSVLAYTAYMFALKELPVGIVSLYAYINPLVAVILGYFLLQEPLTWFTALAFTTIVAGVYLVNYGYRRQHSKKTIKDFGDNEVNALPLTRSNSK